jgi:hypothetical protein
MRPPPKPPLPRRKGGSSLGRPRIASLGESSSALSARLPTTGAPSRMERDSRRLTAAFYGCRSAVEADCAPADAWSSSRARASGDQSEALAYARNARVVARLRASAVVAGERATSGPGEVCLHGRASRGAWTAESQRSAPTRRSVAGVAGQSMTVLAMAGGSRPASSQPAAVAASGTPMMARARWRTGTRLR